MISTNTNSYNAPTLAYTKPKLKKFDGGIDFSKGKYSKYIGFNTVVINGKEKSDTMGVAIEKNIGMPMKRRLSPSYGYNAEENLQIAKNILANQKKRGKEEVLDVVTIDTLRTTGVTDEQLIPLLTEKQIARLRQEGDEPSSRTGTSRFSNSSPVEDQPYKFSKNNEDATIIPPSTEVAEVAEEEEVFVS